MGLLDKMAGVELRGSTISGGHPRDPALVELFGGGYTSASGMVVNCETAMRLSAVFSCVRVLGEALAGTPVNLYRRLPSGGRELAIDHRLYNTVKRRPNPWQTKFSFFELGMYQLNLEGVHYSRIVAQADGTVDLVPLSPSRVIASIDANTGYLIYRYNRPDGGFDTILQDEMLRVMFMSKDGITPMSVITAQRETLGDSLATQQYGAKFFANDATPRSYLKMPGTFKDKEQKKAFSDDWQSSNSGSNRGKTAVLEHGIELIKLGLSNEDAQFLETRKMQRTEISGMFRVPGHLVGDLSGSTNNNIEQQSLEFVMYSMLPWFVRWEQALSQSLLSDKEQDEYYFEFNSDSLLRGDSASRSKYYKDAIYSGWMSRNEVRIKENLNVENGLDEFIVPVNMAPSDNLGQNGNNGG